MHVKTQRTATNCCLATALNNLCIFLRISASSAVDKNTTRSIFQLGSAGPLAAHVADLLATRWLRLADLTRSDPTRNDLTKPAQARPAAATDMTSESRWLCCCRVNQSVINGLFLLNLLLAIY